LLAYAFFGVLILTARPEWLDLLALIRTIFFVVSFMLASWMMWRFQEAKDEAGWSGQVG
jgi:hypothetical protein